MTERRTGSRYPLRLPVLFEQGSGETRDVSTHGVYLITHQQPLPGSDIAFTLRFELNEEHRQKPVFFACRGQVLRAEPQAGMTGVAVRFLDDSFNKPFSVTVSRETNGNFFSQMLVNMTSG